MLITPHVGNTPEMAVPLLSARITENVRRWAAASRCSAPSTRRRATDDRRPSHYATLGVADGAEPEVVRRAYLDLARRLHPDRWIDAGPASGPSVERRMREVNEAWRVLGNPARRLAYDVERRQADRRRGRRRPARWGSGYGFSTGELFAEDVDDPDLLTRLCPGAPVDPARGLPAGDLHLQRLRHLRRGDRGQARRGRRHRRGGVAEAGRRGRRDVPWSRRPGGPRRVIIEAVPSSRARSGRRPFSLTDRDAWPCAWRWVVQFVGPDHVVLRSADPEPLVEWYARPARPRGAAPRRVAPRARCRSCRCG